MGWNWEGQVVRVHLEFSEQKGLGRPVYGDKESLEAGNHRLLAGCM